MLTRHPVVAGTFYPGSAPDLKKMVDDFLQTALVSAPRSDLIPKAIIAPHAGYIYSGAIAASAYARLISQRDQIHRVVLLGPSHHVAFKGLAISSLDCFDTPLGHVKLDRDAIATISDLPDVKVMDPAHSDEHSLEVHLPFLQEVFSDFSIVPVVVGDADAEQVNKVLNILWGGGETLIVISSDLSHYYDYQTAKKMDARTSKMIELLQFEHLNYDDACGRNPVSGLLLAAQKHELNVTTIDLRNSGDTAGPRDRVVGYGAYLFI